MVGALCRRVFHPCAECVRDCQAEFRCGAGSGGVSSADVLLALLWRRGAAGDQPRAATWLVRIMAGERAQRPALQAARDEAAGLPAATGRAQMAPARGALARCAGPDSAGAI